MRSLLAAASALALMGAASSMPGFGDRIASVANQPAPYASADFDGDGVADTVTVVSVAAGKALPGDVTVIASLWPSSWRANQATSRALAIDLGMQHRKFLITGPAYFDSPMWNEKQLPLSVARRDSKPYREFQAREKRIQNDVLVLGTEAGIDTALYWNGKTFALFEPAEEP
jgi:hypothetical protein